MGSSSGGDRLAGYCGNCHWWTSDPRLWPVKRDEYAARRALARRFFDEQAAPLLLGEGVPADGVAVSRRRYVQGVLGDAVALGRLEQWAADGVS